MEEIALLAVPDIHIQPREPNPLQPPPGCEVDRCLPVPVGGIVGPVVLLMREGGALNHASERLVQALRASGQAGSTVVPPTREKASGHQKA